jgi:hypothetical protein
MPGLDESKALFMAEIPLWLAALKESLYCAAFSGVAGKRTCGYQD